MAAEPPVHGPPRLDGVRGFVFDIDGTLVHRTGDGRAQALPGAREVLERIRSSGRPLVLFTNGSHVSAEAIAAGLTRDGVPVSAREVMTPVDSALSYLGRRHRGAPTLLFATAATRALMADAGVAVTDGEDAQVVFVAHVDEVDIESLERGARAVARGAAFFTASYVAAYAGANGPIFSRGAMATAAIAKVTGRRPRVLGKPSRAAINEVAARLGVASDAIAVIGDDARMDIPLGHLGGALTVLVRSGISGSLDLATLPASRRPHAVIASVADLLGSV